jgi:diacylglycerol kinase
MNENDIDRLKFSFRNALIGIKTAYKSQKNLRLHIVISFFVIFLGVFLKVSIVEWLILLLTILMVVITEMFNTALEFTVDLFSTEYSKQAKKAKDVSAAGVLITAFFAILIGITIFLPKLLLLLFQFIYK